MRTISTPSPMINTVARVLMKVVPGLLRDFGEVVHLSGRGLQSFVQATEKRCERILYEGLADLYPSYNFLMEESGFINHGDSKSLWIIDPLDGSNNFSHGFPHFAISIALQEEGQLTAAVIYDPLRDDFFWACRGIGAYLHQYRLRAPQGRDVLVPIVCTKLPSHSEDHSLSLAAYRNVSTQIPHAKFRCMGALSLDLAYVASNRCDAAFASSANPWDIAAGLLLVQEAGGWVCDFHRSKDILRNKQFIATGNRDFHETMCQALGSVQSV